jgi:hypothetical protein
MSRLLCWHSEANLLPRPEIIITAKVIESLQNLSYIGELRQRWEEIKRLQISPTIAT